MSSNDDGFLSDEKEILAKMGLLLYTATYHGEYISNFDIILKNLNSRTLGNCENQKNIFSRMIVCGNIFPLIRLLEYMIKNEIKICFKPIYYMFHAIYRNHGKQIYHNNLIEFLMNNAYNIISKAELESIIDLGDKLMGDEDKDRRIYIKQIQGGLMKIKESK